jgi:hypothetical protein
VVLTIFFFILAIVFREMDSREIAFLPMGTHFLWHAFTGFGGFFILSYLFHLRHDELTTKGTNPRSPLQVLKTSKPDYRLNDC